MYMHIYTFIDVYIDTYIYIYIDIYMYIYIYVCIDTYIYVYGACIARFVGIFIVS